MERAVQEDGKKRCFEVKIFIYLCLLWTLIIFATYDGPWPLKDESYNMKCVPSLGKEDKTRSPNFQSVAQAIRRAATGWHLQMLNGGAGNEVNSLRRPKTYRYVILITYIQT